MGSLKTKLIRPEFDRGRPSVPQVIGHNFTFHPSSIPGKCCRPFFREPKVRSALKCRVLVLTFPMIKGYPRLQQEDGNSQPKRNPNPGGHVGGGVILSSAPPPQTSGLGVSNLCVRAAMAWRSMTPSYSLMIIKDYLNKHVINRQGQVEGR